MPVRVRVRIRSLKGLKAGRVIEANSLLNTGYIRLLTGDYSTHRVS
jgi:hypothetical protein